MKTGLERAIERLQEILNKEDISSYTDGYRTGLESTIYILKEELASERKCETCKKYFKGTKHISPHCSLDDNISEDDNVNYEDCCIHNKAINCLYEPKEGK